MRALGRHVEHDPRSRAFASVPHTGAVVSRSWAHHGGMLNQGELGGCTGFAAAGVLNCSPFYRGHGRLFTNADAIGFYEQATRLDKIPGHYPPDDTGSSGLAVAKALARRGLIASYHHAFGLDAALHAFQRGPLLAGISWYEGFDEPTADGELVIGGAVRGGHEVALNVLDVERKRIGGFSSWGDDFGLKGCFWLSFATFARLLAEQGDVTQLVP